MLDIYEIIKNVKYCIGIEHDGDVRLVRGHNETSGVVEVFLQKKWMAICDRSTWTANDAAVICRQLGLGGGTISAPTNHSTGSVHLGNLECAGSEGNLGDCEGGHDMTFGRCGGTIANVTCYYGRFILFVYIYIYIYIYI